jgi:glyoxylase-like metal-dependent hydrolase (beta-lactamase superfamily II)
MLTQVSANVFHVAGSSVNWYLIRDGDALTLIDCGYPGDAEAVEASVREISHRPADIQAVLVTHAHVDHIGGLVSLSGRFRIPVYVHPLELANARGTQREQASPMDVARRAWRPSVARWAVHVIRAGGTARPVLDQAQVFPTAGALDLPGAPLPIHCPGHTSGHVAYHLPEEGALVTGDALVAGHAISARRGPQMLPEFFASSPGTALTSLTRLAEVDADLILPGHGDPWRGAASEAVELARAVQ